MRTYRGQLIAQKWPKKQTKEHREKNRLQNNFFKSARTLIKYIPTEIWETANLLGEKGPLYPADYIMSTMAGGIYIFQTDDGRTIYPMALINEISNDLNVINQIPGGMIARGTDLWVPVNPTANGQVLYWPDKNSPPVPTSPGPEIGGHSISSMPRTTQNPGTTAAKGVFFELQQSITITQIIPSFNSIDGATYKCELWEWDGTKITTKVTQSDSVDWVGTFFFRRRFQLEDQVILLGGSRYIVIFIRTDATPSTNNQLFSSGESGNGGYPTNDHFGWAEWQKTTLNPGDIPNTMGFSVPFCIDIIFKM